MFRFLSILFYLFTVPVLFQTDPYMEDTIKYLELNGTHQFTEIRYEKLLKGLQREFSEMEITATEWEKVSSGRDTAIAGLKLKLAEVYQEHFKHHEISELIGFYESEAGIQLRTDRTKLTDQHKEDILTFYNTSLGRKVLEHRILLASTLNDMTQEWSDSLEKQMRTALIAYQ